MVASHTKTKTAAEGKGRTAPVIEGTCPMGLGLFRSLVAVQLGEALFLSGDIEAAREATERAVALTRKREEQGHEAYGLRLLGEIALRSDPPDGDAAKKHFEKALGIAEAHDG